MRGAPGSPTATEAPSWWPGLPEAAAVLAGSSADRVGELLRQSDVSLAAISRRQGSSLNNDGTPVELCVSVQRDRRRARLLMDPAHEEPDPARRCGRALAACERCLHSLAEPTFATTFHRALWTALPDRASLGSWLPHGALWLGVDFHRPVLAVYISARWGPPADRWARVLNWLGRLAPVAAEALAPVTALSEPASVGLEGGPCGTLRSKVYFRLLRPTRLHTLGLFGLARPEMEHFLARVIQGQAVRRSGLMFSVFAPVAAAQGAGCKLDLCAHCVRHEPAEWAALIEELAARFGLQDPGASGLLRDGKAEMAFLGFGCAAEASLQMNCYLKAPSRTRECHGSQE